MSSSPAPSEPSPAPGDHSNVRVVIGSVATLLLLASLDQSIVSTALPTIVADLGGVEHLSWVVTAYILASTIVAPLYGKMGDLYGRRLMVFISVGTFLVGSALCGLAGSMTFLILARGLQGLGGGGLFVLALSIIGDVIPPKERGKVQAVFASVFSLSSVAGPLLGGWFVENLSWHWIFYINLPIGALAVTGFALGFRAHPKQVKHRIDYPGAVALSLTLGGLVLLTSLGGNTFAWDSPLILGLGAMVLIALPTFLWIETRAAEPILPLRLFTMNTFWVTSLVSFVTGAVMFGTITFLPMFLQIAKGASPTASGLMMIPMMVGILVSSNTTGRLMRVTGKYRRMLIAGPCFLVVGSVLLSTLYATIPTWRFDLYIVFIGLGMGCIFPVVTTAVQNAVPRETMGTATAAGLMFRQVGGSLSVALFGALFAARMAAELAGMPNGEAIAAQIGPQTLRGLSPEDLDRVTSAVVTSMHPIFLITATLAIVALFFALFLREIPLRGGSDPQPGSQPQAQPNAVPGGRNPVPAR